MASLREPVVFPPGSEPGRITRKAREVYSHDRYDQLVKETVEMIVRLGKEKGGEYAGDNDRLANFRRNGLALELPMETIWRVYAGKHWDAVTQYIVDIQQGKTRPRMESIAGRVDDLIVYLILFKAMVDEREPKIAVEERFTGPSQPRS